MAIEAAKVPAGECGVENQVGRVGVVLFAAHVHGRYRIPTSQTLLDY